MKKIIVVFCVVVALISTYSISSQACTKTEKCYATTETVTCGSTSKNVIGGHNVKEPNGYSSYCTISSTSGNHTITCSGCGAVLRYEYRTCAVDHTNVHCFSQHNLCK